MFYTNDSVRRGGGGGGGGERSVKNRHVYKRHPGSRSRLQAIAILRQIDDYDLKLGRYDLTECTNV